VGEGASPHVFSSLGASAEPRVPEVLHVVMAAQGLPLLRPWRERLGWGSGFIKPLERRARMGVWVYKTIGETG